MYYIRVFFSSLLAGIAIAIGGTAFLSCDDKVVGAFLFSIGLYMICMSGWHLYTGRIGTLWDQKPKYLLELVIMWVGNLIGACGVGYAIRMTRLTAAIEKAQTVSQAKLNDSLWSILLLSIFCGILVQFAVWSFRTAKHPFLGAAAVFMGVTVFIACGFEHCIANMYYFSVADAWSLDTLGSVLVMTLGNSIGGLLAPTVEKFIKKP